MLITDPWFYLVAIPAVLLTGISKTGFGGGSGGVAVPLMAMVIAPTQAAGIMLPILCFMDILSWRAYRGHWDRANMRIILPGAVVGIAVGTALFGLFSDSIIRLMLGLIAVVFGLNQWFGFTRRIKQQVQGPSVGRGLLWSALSGFTSFLAHAGGPPLMVYLLPQRLDKTLFVGTSVVFFFVVNFVKLVPYGFLGQLSGGNLLTSLALAPLAPAGVQLGVWLHRCMSDAVFYRIVLVLMLGTGIKLLHDGLRALV